MAELVDAQDLKSCLPKGEYGFDSRLGHKGLSNEVGRAFLFCAVKERSLSINSFLTYR